MKDQIKPQRSVISWQESLNAILRQNWDKHASKDKQVGFETKEARKEILFLCFEELHGLGYLLKSPSSLRTRHVQALVDYWVSKTLSAATIQSRLSTLRRLAEWIGKKGMIGSAESFVSNPDIVKRTYVAKTDKSWSAQEIDITEVIQRVEREDRYVGMQLKLMLAFGLRRKEAVMFRPFRAHVGNLIALDSQAGTKGGKARIIPIESPMQQLVLNEAKIFVKIPSNHVGRPELTLQQAIKRFANIMIKCGITKIAMGITSHGLRHQYLNDYYERIAGVPSPVRDAEKSTHGDSSQVALAKMKTSAVAGHVRPSITTAYTGSQKSIKKPNEFPTQQQILFDDPL